MPRYIETANKASVVLDGIMNHLKDHPEKDLLLSQIIYLFNMGIRISPRGVQSTVRLNAVKQVAKNQPAQISLIRKPFTNSRGQADSYNAINIQISPTINSQDGDSDDDE